MFFVYVKRIVGDKIANGFSGPFATEEQASQVMTAIAIQTNVAEVRILSKERLIEVATHPKATGFTDVRLMARDTAVQTGAMPA